MAKELSMTEKYTLLMLYGGGNRTDFMGLPVYRWDCVRGLI